MVINNIFNIGQIVYLKTDKDQIPRLVVRFSVTREAVLYVLAQGTGESTHYDIEISEEVNVLLQTTN